jgi:hypothetical protein
MLRKRERERELKELLKLSRLNRLPSMRESGE